MDKLTRDILVSLLKWQAATIQAQAGILSMIQAGRGETTERVRAACEGVALISRLVDPDKRREAMDALWVAMDGPEQSTAEKAASELKRAAARLDYKNDGVVASIADLIKGLQSIPLEVE